MIVITGPGRSGTSAIAALYAELGFFPGGEWSEEVAAGYEDPRVVQLNHRIARALGVTVVGYHLPRRLLGIAAWAKPHLSEGLRRRVWRAWGRLPGVRARGAEVIDWARLDRVVAELGSEMRELASSSLVVKDPVFAWVLPAWIHAGADISELVVCTRRVDDILRSREKARLSHFRTEGDMRNAVVYGLGVCLSAAADSGVDVALIRYPDFLSDPGRLFEALPFPRPVDYETFCDVLSRVVRPDLLNRSGSAA